MLKTNSACSTNAIGMENLRRRRAEEEEEALVIVEFRASNFSSESWRRLKFSMLDSNEENEDAPDMEARLSNRRIEFA